GLSGPERGLLSISNRAIGKLGHSFGVALFLLMFYLAYVQHFTGKHRISVVVIRNDYNFVRAGREFKLIKLSRKLVRPQVKVGYRFHPLPPNGRRRKNKLVMVGLQNEVF